ncbi:MAG: Zn-dependent hydrolase [Proteobacteria bacterium]|nr:Zn-dependent hydrolase [Pseudomonadota bacterium]
MKSLRICASRLWATIEETGLIGATPNGGLSRLSLSSEDRQVRDWLVDQCREAGCKVGVDELGNVFAERAGRTADRAPIAFGSHLDTQPAGGRFDGVLGVLAGLEVIRTLNDNRVETQTPLCLVNWTNEEGCRFAPALLASGVYSGEFGKDWALERTDVDNVTFGNALTAIGYRGSEPVGQRKFEAFLELHIEQGPVLERNAQTIGVVESAQGLIWYDAEIVGVENHAGTTPMELRRDALAAFADICLRIESIARNCPGAVGTVGYVRSVPGSRNTVPGRALFSIEFRHPETATIEEMDKALLAAASEISHSRSIEVSIEEITRKAPTRFDRRCVAAIEAAVQHLGYPYRRMSSGAAHDSCNVNTVAPTAMIFVPCRNGVSHSESEDATPEDCAAGANVLLQAVGMLDNSDVRPGQADNAIKVPG